MAGGTSEGGGGSRRKVSGGRTMQVDEEELRSYLANADIDTSGEAEAEALVVDSAPQTPSMAPPPLPKRSNRGPILIGVAVVTVCVLLAVATGLMMDFGPGETATAEDPTPEVEAADPAVTEEPESEATIVPIALDEVVFEFGEEASEPEPEP